MNKNHIKELSIQINLNGLSFCVKNNNTVETLYTSQFEQELTPFDTLNRLKTELEKQVFSESFSSIKIIHQNNLATFIPEELYDENHNADYLKFNTKILKSDFITHDTISSNNSVNVYIPYVNINNYIFEQFGEFTYQHSASVFLQTLLKKDETSHEKTKVYINVNKTSIEIFAINNNELQLFNVFDYSSPEDFIYYVLFVFEQLNLNTETNEVVLSGLIDLNDNLYSILYTYVRHISFIESNYDFNFRNTIEIKKLHHNYLILNSF